jgi:hypothetical protein
LVGEGTPWRLFLDTRNPIESLLGFEGLVEGEGTPLRLSLTCWGRNPIESFPGFEGPVEGKGNPIEALPGSKNPQRAVNAVPYPKHNP